MDKLTEAQINQMNSLVLAYVGDAVFTLYVRTRLATMHDCKSGALNKMANRFVRAPAQSEMLCRLSDKLTDAEAEVVRRARNRHKANKAKNAGLAEYKRSTGLEALFGWLYLTGQDERLNDLETACMEVLDE